MTRNCIEPWRAFQFDAEGNVSPCCSGTMTGNFGNIRSDLSGGYGDDIFANNSYRALRRGLLTGKLLSSCKSCRSVHDEDVTISELRSRVINHLESQGVNSCEKDLSHLFSFSECGGNITNKCNLSCVYCSHSGENGHKGYFLSDMPKQKFLDFVDWLCSKGLKIFNFCGIGELTAYPGWQALCEELFSKHPELKLRIISNFCRRLNETELDTLTRFELIHVSCDTLDEQLFAWLRRGGQLPVLLDNVKRLKKRFPADQFSAPRLVFNITATDSIIEHLEGLFRFAADNSMFIHISDLFVMNGSVASTTNCVKQIYQVDSGRILRVRELFSDLPRRMKAQNPLTNVWEYKFIYNNIMQKADQLTLNRFIPDEDELFYLEFSRKYINNEDAYLRKIWLSFDEGIRGIFIRSGKNIVLEIPLPFAKMVCRATWCSERVDGNFDIRKGVIEEFYISGTVAVSAENCHEPYHFILFEVLACTLFEGNEMVTDQITPNPPGCNTQSLMVREAFLLNEENSVVRRFVATQEHLVIWCAGLRTLQMLSNTCLGQANIKMVIDGDPAKTGQMFCGYRISSPGDLGDYEGKIVVIHASCPEQVEAQIRCLGISNEVIIL